VEQYVAKGTFGTDWTLPYAFNLDLTSIKPSSKGDHSWPWEWYLATIQNPLAPVVGGLSVGPYGWGFQRTLEYGGNLPSFAAFPRGRRVDLQTGQVLDESSPVHQEEMDLPLDPTAVSVSNSQLVTGVGTTGFTMRTGSPVWLSTPLDVPPGFDLLRFEYEFLSKSSGHLTLALDGEPAFEVEEALESGKKVTDWIWLGTSAGATAREARFALDTGSASGSQVRISALKVGKLGSGASLPTLSVQRAGDKLGIFWSLQPDSWVLESAADPLGLWTSWSGPLVGGEDLGDHLHVPLHGIE
jgi:hypothetical protein